MGSEDYGDPPVHRVTVSGFKMSRFPVTNLQYSRFVEDMRREPPAHWQQGRIPEGKEDHPVVRVAWADADAFCSWLSRRIRSNRGGAVQLPTEAQWEFAARGAEGRRYPWGEDEPTPDHANFGGEVGDTTAVGRYRKGSTPLGIHDLAGNVWEWCRDWYAAYEKKPARDPVGPKSGTSRVLRGGSFDFRAPFLRSAFRGNNHPDIVVDDVGFRVVWVSAGGQE